jgi:cell division protein FtsQ
MARRKNRYIRSNPNKERVWTLGKALLTSLRWFGLIASVGGISTALVLSYYAIIKAPYFQVKGVEITGCRRVDHSTIIKSMGIKPGVNILELNLHRITKELQNVEWIERISIRRRLPDHVVVKVWEREPCALINLDCLYYLDKTGTAFKRTVSGDDLNYPIITGFSKEFFYGRSDRSREAMNRVFELINILDTNKAPFGLDQVSEIHVGQEDCNITVLLSRGEFKIHFGSDGFEKKLQRLVLIHSDLVQKGRLNKVKFIDLDLGNRVRVS